ncbi:MAG: NUDIX domain-containing protein [Hyphomicrobium sp.]
MPFRKLVTKSLQRYWRTSRGLRLGICACVRDAGGRILFVRPWPDAPWRIPGGGVGRGETAETALGRCLLEEAEIEISGPVRLFAVYCAGREAQGDQMALYLVPSWKRAAGAGRERLETVFLDPGRLPHDLEAASRRRVCEILEARATSEIW